MFTNEIKFDETVTVLMDETAEHDDVELLIDDDGVWLKQWCETLNSYEFISMSHQMFYELQEALKKPEGMYRVSYTSTDK
jgi:hypothetical protein